MYESIINKLDSQIKNNKLSHAYLFEVNNYNEDFKVILNFVKMIVSNMTYDEVINSDKDEFKQIDGNEYIDLYIIEPDGNEIKKNQMTKLMDEFNNTSILDNKRVYIIKECEKFNKSSANTILKFLEEPSSNIIGILLTNNRYKVIETIVSRCQNITFTDSEIDNNYEEYIDLLDFICNIKKNILNYDDIFNKYFVDKSTSRDSLIILEKILYDYLNNKLNINNIKLDQNSASKMIIIIENEKNKLNYNVNIKLWFDDLLVRIMEVLI